MQTIYYRFTHKLHLSVVSFRSSRLRTLSMTFPWEWACLTSMERFSESVGAATFSLFVITLSHLLLSFQAWHMDTHVCRHSIKCSPRSALTGIITLCRGGSQLHPRNLVCVLAGHLGNMNELMLAGALAGAEMSMRDAGKGRAGLDEIKCYGLREEVGLR